MIVTHLRQLFTAVSSGSLKHVTLKVTRKRDGVYVSVDAFTGTHTFGLSSYVLPASPPRNRARRGSWRHAVSGAANSSTSWGRSDHSSTPLVVRAPQPRGRPQAAARPGDLQRDDAVPVLPGYGPASGRGHRPEARVSVPQLQFEVQDVHLRLGVGLEPTSERKDAAVTEKNVGGVLCFGGRPPLPGPWAIRCPRCGAEPGIRCTATADEEKQLGSPDLLLGWRLLPRTKRTEEAYLHVARCPL